MLYGDGEKIIPQFNANSFTRDFGLRHVLQHCISPVIVPCPSVICMQ